MSRIERVRAGLESELQPTHLSVVDESHQHHRGGEETHLRVVVVASGFIGLSPVERQRRVYTVLNSELNSGLHALALRTLTPEEWAREGGQDSLKSPLCQSGRSRPT